jgi:hypothetical protein
MDLGAILIARVSIRNAEVAEVKEVEKIEEAEEGMLPLGLGARPNFSS